MAATSKNYQYGNTIEAFLKDSADIALAEVVRSHQFDIRRTDTFSWDHAISILRNQLDGIEGYIYLEFDIPRMGHRIDAVVLHRNTIFVLEFKVGQTSFHKADREQAWDYALDLHNFHELSHSATIVPVLIATEAKTGPIDPKSSRNDTVFDPIAINADQLRSVLSIDVGNPISLPLGWADGRYKPTPTIVEAAKALYQGHGVEDITRSGAEEKNLTATTSVVDKIIERSRSNGEKSICFVTGVPGAGKTLVGLNVATKHSDPGLDKEQHAVYLSGNGPLVKVLTEALARDRVLIAKNAGEKQTLTHARSEVKAFIQNVHHFRDECLRIDGAPVDHVALFDEAQRAWNEHQTADFMARKKNRPGFTQSEPEFLISCLDRHPDWAVIVCLVGGGQEINKGEAGILEWVNSVNRRFPHWRMYLSSRLNDNEHNPGGQLSTLIQGRNVEFSDDLHLSVSMRSFRSEHVSNLVKALLDLEVEEASSLFSKVSQSFPIVLTRSVSRAREWLCDMRRGTQRSGLVVSSNAERLKAKGIHVKAPIDPVHWFLEPDDDVRSSCFHEDVATEFDVQGLELDWTGVVWDADFRWTPAGWQNFEFKGNKWQKVSKADRQAFQKNAYRVLLTRARQGMVLVVPEGNPNDMTRQPEFYDGTYNYLKGIGLQTL